MAFNVKVDKNDNADRMNADLFCPPGWYRVSIEDATEDEKSGAAKIDYKVILPKQWAGSTIKDSIQNPAFAEDEEKARKHGERAKRLAFRMGIITEEELKPGAEISFDYADAIGTEVVINTETRKFKGNDGTDKEMTGLKYLGLYPLDHDKIPEVVRKELQLPPARPTKGKAGAGASPAGNGAGGAASEPLDL